MSNVDFINTLFTFIVEVHILSKIHEKDKRFRETTLFEGYIFEPVPSNSIQTL